MLAALLLVGRWYSVHETKTLGGAQPGIGGDNCPSDDQCLCPPPLCEHVLDVRLYPLAERVGLAGQDCQEERRHTAVEDGPAIHPVWWLIAEREWLTVFLLPAYSPDLNPVEGVWAHVKRSLANLTVGALDRLEALVRHRLKHLLYRPDTLDGFIAGTGLTLDDPTSP
ncbi:transposase [Streptomyces sp. NPDC087218]|uniref:transposase n=1 Tax=Streptomyces sp. NPDC087218 TaxID=3365769 RepID=UPI0037FD83D8